MVVGGVIINKAPFSLGLFTRKKNNTVDYYTIIRASMGIRVLTETHSGATDLKNVRLSHLEIVCLVRLYCTMVHYNSLAHHSCSAQ